jgi:hypothetical protein
MRYFSAISLKQALMLIVLLLSLALVGCNGDGDEHGDGGGGGGGDVDEASDNLVSLKMDLSNSAGLLTTDNTGSARMHRKNARYLGIEPNERALGLMQRSSTAKDSGDDESNLKKVDSNGDVSSTMEMQKGRWAPSLPTISSIGISPAKEAYFQFERNFVYRTTDDSGKSCDDPWSPSSPCSCQLFKLKSTLSEWADGSAKPEFNNMECVDNEHRLDSWMATGTMFQFDSSSNVYFLAGFENGQGTVLYKVSKDKVDGKFQKTEMVNRSICVRDWRVTKNGGLFYVGENCVDGQWSGDGSFFRYVSPDGTLTEVARNWWDYNFEPIEGASGDQVLFFGPDPDSSEVAKWDSACLFKFDPSLAEGSRATQLVTCNQHIWDWLELRRQVDKDTYGIYQAWNNPPFAWRTEYSRRCLNNSDTFIGSNSGSPVKTIVQDSTGKAYIVGDISKKNAGTFKCNIEIKGNFCVLNGIPALRNSSDNYTRSTCESDGGTWTTSGNNTQRYNDNAYRVSDTNNVTTYETGHICMEQGDNSSIFSTGISSSSDNDTTVKLKINYIRCEQPSLGWTTDYKGMAYVDNSTNMLDLLSDTDEQVSEMWLVNDELYYTAYAQQYRFVKEKTSDNNTSLLTNFEVYHVGPSPRGGGKILFDGLNFSNNSYTFGDLDPSANDVKGSITTSSGLTGRIRTMVIYGTD